MGDIFDQAAGSQATGDIFDQAATSSSVSPIPSPEIRGVSRPNVQMHKSFMVGNPEGNADNTGQSLLDKIKAEIIGQAKGAYQVSAPGIAQNTIGTIRGDAQAKQQLSETPLNAGLFLAGMMGGEVGQGPIQPRSAIASGAVDSGVTKSAGALLRQELASRIPLAKRFGAHPVTFEQMLDLVRQKAAPPEVAPPAAPVPTGPSSMWGKMIDTAVPGESIPEWWARRGGKFAGQETPPVRQTPTPSPTTPPPTAVEPDMEMLRRQAGIRPEPAAPSAENTFMGELAKKKPVNLSELEAAGAKHETRTVEKAALERPKTEAERIQQEAARRGQPLSPTADVDSATAMKADEAARTKAAGFKAAAAKRQATGQLTGKEQAAIARKQAGNYVGKPVTFQGQQGTVQGTAFGKIRVKLADGSVVSAEADAIQAAKPPASKADLLEDKGIMERMRASMEADRVKAAQEYRANNTITTTKGELVEKAGTVKYTTTPPAPAKVNLNDPSTLQKLLKQSVKAAKAKKR